MVEEHIMPRTFATTPGKPDLHNRSPACLRQGPPYAPKDTMMQRAPDRWMRALAGPSIGFCKRHSGKISIPNN